MRIDAFLQSQNIKLSNVSAILDRVDVGDIVRAQVLEITASDLMLKLFDGSTIKAGISNASEPIDAMRGEFLDFEVKEKLDNRVVLEPVKCQINKSSNNGEELVKQVKSLGILPEAQNLDIAKELKFNNIPINKANFEKIVDIMTAFKDINPSKAVFLLATKLGIEEKNISALNQLVDENVKISKNMEGLLSSLESINDETILSNIVNKLTSSNALEDTQGLQHDLSDNMKHSIQVTKKDAFINDIEMLLHKASKDLSDINFTQNPVSEESIILDRIKAFFNYNKNSTEGLDERFENFMNRYLQNQGKSISDINGTTSELIRNIVSVLKNNGEVKNRIDYDNNAFLRENSDGPIIEDCRKEIKTIIEKLYVNINSDNLKEELNVKDLYKELYDKLEIIKESINSSNLNNKGEILKNIDQMENNIRFMNQLNSYNTYVQIPLNIWDRNTTGELYVLRRGSKKRKIDPENTTMLISLNTENIGKIDTFIDIRNKNVNVSMRVEDNRIIEFIKDYHNELYQRMNDKGFKLVDLKFRIPEEDINLINVNEVVEKEFNIGKVSIDYRL